jgi:hypothetical protein
MVLVFLLSGLLAGLDGNGTFYLLTIGNKWAGNMLRHGDARKVT